MAYATVDKIEAEGRPAASPEEAAKWEAWLERVERSIVRRFARAGLVLADEIAAGTLTVQDVADVEVAAVLRKIDNPGGVTSVTKSVDDASITTRREISSGDPLALTADEWTQLLPAVASSAWSTRPGFVSDALEPDLWT